MAGGSALTGCLATSTGGRYSRLGLATCCVSTTDGATDKGSPPPLEVEVAGFSGTTPIWALRL